MDISAARARDEASQLREISSLTVVVTGVRTTHLMFESCEQNLSKSRAKNDDNEHAKSLIIYQGQFLGRTRLTHYSN